MVQAHIYYSGIVQGVGFRYSVSRYASELGLDGWVKNLPTGGVEVLVEGPKEMIEKFCGAVEGHFNCNIDDKEISYHEARGEFKGFRIAY